MKVAPRLVPLSSARRIAARARVDDRAPFEREPPEIVVGAPAPAADTAFAAQQLGQEWLPPAPEIDPARGALAYRQRSRPAVRTPRLRAVA